MQNNCRIESHMVIIEFDLCPSVVATGAERRPALFVSNFCCMMDGVFIWRVADDKGQGRCVGQRNTRRGATRGQLAGTDLFKGSRDAHNIKYTCVRARHPSDRFGRLQKVFWLSWNSRLIVVYVLALRSLFWQLIDGHKIIVISNRMILY